MYRANSIVQSKQVQRDFSRQPSVRPLGRFGAIPAAPDIAVARFTRSESQRFDRGDPAAVL